MIGPPRSLTALFCLLLCLAATVARAVPPAPWEVEGLRGQTAPALRLSGPSGEGPVALDTLRGSVVLVNFWATWCAPCRREMPELEKLYQRFRAKGFTILGVAVDDDPKVVRAFARRLGVTFPILVDPDQATARAYKVFAFPTTFLVDRQGVIRTIYTGEQEWTGTAVTTTIDQLLQEPAADCPPAAGPAR